MGGVFVQPAQSWNENTYSEYQQEQWCVLMEQLQSLCSGAKHNLESTVLSADIVQL